MSIQMLKTWTICLIIAITLANLGLGVPLPESKEILPNTTLDVVLQKFPSLNTTKLDPNLVDILNKTCADWQAINSTNSVTKSGDTNAQCLVLYESLTAFCSSFGDSLPKYLALIPSLVPTNMTITIKNICSDSQGLYSLKDGEHKISNILQADTKPMNCYLLCSSFGENGVPIIHDTCKYSYFFTSFEAAKFLEDINARLNTTTVPSLLLSQNKIVPLLETAQVAEKKGLQTPNQTVKDTANSHLVADALAQPQAVNEQPKDTAAIKTEAPAKHLYQNNLPVVAEKPDALAVNADLPVAVEKADSIAEQADLVVRQKADSVAENSDSVAKKPEKTADAVADIPVAENPLEAEVKKNIPDPVVKNNKNEAPANVENNNSLEGNANQDEMEDEEAEEAALAQEEANAKPEPVMPEEIAEVKTPSIKGKPNTVEDEPISSYNIPEDDMNGDSYFFSYFTVLMCLVIVGYVGYHNRQKILALVLEGKRGKRSGRQARRPNSSNYHKLDSNLEEAISSSCTKNASNLCQ